MATIYCASCEGKVSEALETCPHCGHPLSSKSAKPKEIRTEQPQQQVIMMQSMPSNGIAAVLSFIIPGVGQMYKGYAISGLFWLLITIVGYAFFVIPGIILHVICILGAAMGESLAAKKNRKLEKKALKNAG